MLGACAKPRSSANTIELSSALLVLSSESLVYLEEPLLLL